MKWKRGSFKIKIKDCSDQGFELKEVKGMTLKEVFGIETGRITVTHIPTGCVFGPMGTYAQAKNYAEIILPLTDWKVLKDLEDDKLRNKLIKIRRNIMGG